MVLLMSRMMTHQDNVTDGCGYSGKRPKRLAIKKALVRCGGARHDLGAFRCAPQIGAAYAADNQDGVELCVDNFAAFGFAYMSRQALRHKGFHVGIKPETQTARG